MTVPWMVDALCAQTDPDLFFPEDDWQTARAAKRVCASCPVRAECLDYAVRNVVPHPVAPTIGDLDKLFRAVGDALVRGGLIEDDRHIVKLTAEKSWAVGEKPGVIIRVSELT